MKAFEMMRELTQKLKTKFYERYDHPYSVYEKIIEKKVNLDSIVFDVGCGRDAYVIRKIAVFCRVPVGMDICDLSKIEDNNHIHLFEGDLANIAARDSSIEAVISRSVLEHVKDPIKVYQEIHRILKPDGYFIFLTPNLYDYASVIAKLIPNRFHSKIVKMTEGRDEHDTFPTYYRANTKRTILTLAKSTGFKVVTISMLGQYPSYLTFNPLLFLMGTAYDKIICRYEFLSHLRGWILCVLQKNDL